MAQLALSHATFVPRETLAIGDDLAHLSFQTLKPEGF